MGKIKVYRGLLEVVELDLANAVFSKRLQGEHNLVFNVRSSSPLDIKVGDRLTYKGEVMEVNKPIDLDKVSSFDYRGQIVFQGLRHRLSRWILDDEGKVIFNYTATLDDFMFMFLESLNSKDVDGGWSVGELDVVDVFSIDFDCTNFWDAINMIAEGAGCEWQLKGKAFTIKKTVGQATTIQLSYGKDNGLYGLSRKSVDNLNIVNSAYGIGGNQNLPLDYSHSNLMLTSKVQDLASIAAIGLREGVFKDETIFPKGDGNVSGIGQINEGTWFISDTSIDFDLQGQFIQGVEPKIVFLTGALNGQEFKVLGYKHNSKTIRYEANKDSNGGLIPFGLYRAEIGDKYFISGIRMPQSYVDAALLELGNKTQEYVNSNKNARPVYDLDIDLLDAKRKAVYPNESDLIRVKDTEIGIDEDLRVTFISYPGNFPELLEQGKKFTCEVGHDITYSRIALVEKNIKETKEVVTTYRNQSIELNRLGVTALNEFRDMVFDPDGQFQQPMIEAMAGIFGTKSQCFDLDGVTITENLDSDPNKASFSGGSLVHYSYEIPTIGNVWTIAPLLVSSLEPMKPYYISVKADRITAAATWDVSLVKRLTDEDPAYWYFNFGVLTSVIENRRSIRPTNMFTAISGGTIETNILIARMLMLPYMSIGKNGENAQRFYYDLEQQKTAAIFGLINGKHKLAWYAEDGTEVWNASEKGIIYVTNTPESWRNEGMFLVQEIASESDVLDEPLAKSTLQINAVRDSPTTAHIGGETVYDLYDAGTNENTTANSIYEGYHVGATKASPFIPNGFYVITGISPNYDQLMTDGSGYFDVFVGRYWNGKQVGNMIIVKIYVPE
ncbi:hypothetical protein ACP6L2_01280 [Sphingobacterium lactis]|uniref:hypothetical protein n=1 Tax=Sphingobacterium lactis TaxID=797291 RepID=UPI003F7D4CF3